MSATATAIAALDAFRAAHDHDGAETTFMTWRFVEPAAFAVGLCCPRCEEAACRVIRSDPKTIFPDWILATVLAGTDAGPAH